MERRMKSKQGFHTRSKSLTEEPVEPVIQRQSTYDDHQIRRMDGGGDQDIWMNSFSSWKMKRMQATSSERDRKAERDEVEQSHQKLRRKKSKTFREIVEEKQRREKMFGGSSVDTTSTDNGEFPEILADLPSTNLDSDNEQEIQKSLPVFEESAPPPRRNNKEERDHWRNEMKEKVPEPEVITMTESSRVFAAPPPSATRGASPPPTRGSAPMSTSRPRDSNSHYRPQGSVDRTRGSDFVDRPQESDPIDRPLSFREKVLLAQESERDAKLPHEQAKDAARKPYKPKQSRIFDKIRAFDSGAAFKKVVEDAVEADKKPGKKVEMEEGDYEDLVIIMTQKARSYKSFGFTTSGGYDERKPLVVASVSAGSVADYSDLKVGDQLLNINKENTRRFNQDDVQQCLSQSILSGKLTCKVRRYPDGKVPDNAVFQNHRPPPVESRPPPVRSWTAPSKRVGNDPPPTSERTQPPPSALRVQQPPQPAQRVEPPQPTTRGLPPRHAERNDPPTTSERQGVYSPPTADRLQTLTEVEPADDGDGDVLRPGPTKNALARARQMLDELEIDDESSSRSSEITDQSPVPSLQSSNRPLYSQPPKNDNFNQQPDDADSGGDDRSSSSEDASRGHEPASQLTAPASRLIGYHTPSSSIDEGSTRSQDSFPRGFRSIAAPRPRDQPSTLNGPSQVPASRQRPQSDTHKRRNDFFPNGGESDEPIIAPERESTNHSMPAPRPIKPSTAHRKPFNREEERQRLERWNEEQERRRQERYELEQQRLREDEERALLAAEADVQQKREQEEWDLEARRLERQRQQEELQLKRQRQLEEEEKRRKARLEKERLEREEAERERREREAERKREEEARRREEEQRQKEEREERERAIREAAAERERIAEERERLRREREQREQAAREVIRKEREDYARILEEREQERIRLEEEEEEKQRLELEKWRRESQERARADQEREQREQAAREVIKREQENQARILEERERERIRLEEEEEQKRLKEEEEEEEKQRLELEKWRLESQEREKADRARQEEAQRQFQEEERERIRAEEREKMRQEWEAERKRELEQLRLQKEQLARERQELNRVQETERRRLQAEKERIKKEQALESQASPPPLIEVPLGKMTNGGEVMSAPPSRQSLSQGSSPRSVGQSSGSVGHSPRSGGGQSSGSVAQSPRTISPATQRTRENNQRNMIPERDRPPQNHSIMSHLIDPNIPSNQHWLVQEAERRRVAEQKGLDRPTPPDVVIPPPRNGVPPKHQDSGYPRGFDPEIPTRIPAQRRQPPPHSQEAPANMTGVRRRMRGPEGEADRQRKMVNRRSLPDLSSGRESAVPSNQQRPAQQTTGGPPVGRSPGRGQPPIPGRGSAFQEPNKNVPPNQAVSGKMRCGGCRKPLGRGAAMIIESLGLHYHVDCFRCCVCSLQLGNGSKGTDVRIRASQLHCQNCYSNEAGFQFTEV